MILTQGLVEPEVTLVNRLYALSKSTLVHQAYHVLERVRWRRRKGRYVLRSVRRLSVAVYRLPSAPMLANTSCKAMTGAVGTSASSIPLPP